MHELEADGQGQRREASDEAWRAQHGRGRDHAARKESPGSEPQPVDGGAPAPDVDRRAAESVVVFGHRFGSLVPEPVSSDAAVNVPRTFPDWQKNSFLSKNVLSEPKK